MRGPLTTNVCVYTFLTGDVQCCLAFVITLVEDEEPARGLDQVVHRVVPSVPVHTKDI